MQNEQPMSRNKRQKAIDAIKGGMTYRKASRKFGIAIANLYQAVNEAISLKQGGQIYLTMKMEDELIDTAKYLSERGFGITLPKFLELATHMVNSITKSKYPLTRLSRKWWRGFKSRHSGFDCCRPKGRADIKKLEAEQNEGAILSFYEEFDNLDQKFNFIPSQVWNADETGSCQKESAAFIVANTKQKTIGSRISTNAKHMTLLACISADGTYSPPLFICKAKTVNRNILDNAIPESMIMTSSSGYINETIFNQWFLKWITWVRNKTSSTQLLILDNCGSHIRHSTIMLAKEYNIELLALPPNLTHILQPLDVGVFKSFKSKIHSSLANTLIRNRVSKLSDAQFIELQCSLLISTFTTDCVKDAFKAVGLFPTDPEKAFKRLDQQLIFSESRNGNKRQTPIDKLRSKVGDLKTEIAKLQSNALISTIIPKKRIKTEKCVVAQVLTQRELKQTPIVLLKSKVQGQKRKLSTPSVKMPGKKQR